jgi:hypothetical protein
MSNLVAEILLRLAKAGVAAALGLLIWIGLVGVAGVTASAELALLCWIAAAVFVLLVESSPI